MGLCPGQPAALWGCWTQASVEPAPGLSRAGRGQRSTRPANGSEELRITSSGSTAIGCELPVGGRWTPAPGNRRAGLVGEGAGRSAHLGLCRVHRLRGGVAPPPTGPQAADASPLLVKTLSPAVLRPQRPPPASHNAQDRRCPGQPLGIYWVPAVCRGRGCRKQEDGGLDPGSCTPKWAAGGLGLWSGQEGAMQN